MSTRICAVSLSLLAGACALALPTIAHAGNVGYYDDCSYFALGDPTGAITAAGHTKVTVTTLDAASLNGLSALVMTSCYGSTFLAPSAALNSAVNNGMGLVVEVVGTSANLVSTSLPGAPTFSSSATIAYPAADNIELAAGSPITNGPGGTLTSTNLDRGIPTSLAFNFLNSYPVTQLPAGAIPFLTTANPSDVVAFGYQHGAGRIAFANSHTSVFLPGGLYPATSETFTAGLSIYLTNAIAWAAGDGAIIPPTTTCASEGYKGAKLTWCQNICENGLTGQVLDTWIHRWVNRYRQLPYCAVEAPSNPV